MEQNWLESLYFMLLAGLGGIVNYLIKARKFVFSDFCIRFLSSGFTGYLISLLCIYFEMPSSMTGFMAGVFGYLGVEVTIKMARKLINTKLDEVN